MKRVIAKLITSTFMLSIRFLRHRLNDSSDFPLLMLVEFFQRNKTSNSIGKFLSGKHWIRNPNTSTLIKREDGISIEQAWITFFYQGWALNTFFPPLAHYSTDGSCLLKTFQCLHSLLINPKNYLVTGFLKCASLSIFKVWNEFVLHALSCWFKFGWKMWRWEKTAKLTMFLCIMSVWPCSGCMEYIGVR